MNINNPTTSPLSRRFFLRYVGHAGAGAAMSSMLGPFASGTSAVETPFTGNWKPASYPLPMPSDSPGSAPAAFFEVVDRLDLADGFEGRLLVVSGVEVGAEGARFKVGTGCDYIGIIPRAGRPNEFWMVVNHEYVSSLPWIQEWQAEDSAAPRIRIVEGSDDRKWDLSIDDEILPGAELDFQGKPEKAVSENMMKRIREICYRAMDAVGLSVLVIKQDPAKGWVLLDNDSGNKYCSGVRSVGFRTDGERFTGPLRYLAGFNRAVPPRTFSNCSGGNTPWGTVLTCEENNQNMVWMDIDPAGNMLPRKKEGIPGVEPFVAEGDPAIAGGIPYSLTGLAAASGLDQDGRYFGWTCEVDPERGTLVKHTALGRFRHENVALRAEAGQPLAAYQGDDRRGGHVYKYVSHDLVEDPLHPSNSRLLEKGILYAARFHPDHTGRWIPLLPSTPIAYPQPELCADGFVWLPHRPKGGLVRVATHPEAFKDAISPSEWVKSIVESTGKSFRACRLGDLVMGANDAEKLAVIMLDAFAMCNACGATPTSRPEDLELHPKDGSVVIAFTDSTGGGDGSPDRLIFPDSTRLNSRQYGAVFRLAEDDNRAGATTFTWGQLVASGEAAEGGGGFACADNLAFDNAGNLWMVTDISSSALNAPVTRQKSSDQPGGSKFRGVFGNNSLFMIPTSGPRMGQPRCFAVGPMESELTGICFSPDGGTLFVAVQHPGEIYGTRSLDARGEAAHDIREYLIADAEGRLHRQTRRVPIGSNYPTGIPGDVPKSAVVVVQPKRLPG